MIIMFIVLIGLAGTSELQGNSTPIDDALTIVSMAPIPGGNVVVSDLVQTVQVKAEDQ